MLMLIFPEYFRNGQTRTKELGQDIVQIALQESNFIAGMEHAWIGGGVSKLLILWMDVSCIDIDNWYVYLLLLFIFDVRKGRVKKSMKIPILLLPPPH